MLDMDRARYSKEECWAVADALASERLPEINHNSSKVVPANGVYVRYIKRVLDIALSGIALAVTSPINLFLLLGTFIDVGSPVIFKQKRIGKDGKEFTVYKFRNMTNETDEKGELLPAAKRVTRFGKFVRKTSLDELLNFWSVFKGDMSIIGPRPLLPEYTRRYSDRHKMRLSVRPGLECPPRTNINLRPSWQDQFENDVWYVENVSLKTDITMCLNLIRFAFNPKATSSRGNANRGAFMGYSKDGVAIDITAVDDDYAFKIIGH